MTYQKTKDLLESIRAQKRLCLRIKQEIDNIRDNYDALTSPLGNLMPGRSSTQTSSVERMAMRLLSKQEEFEKALKDMMDLEDKLSYSINTLSPAEQDIIIGYYMQDKTHYKLARECCYSENHIWRIKTAAIEKIAQALKTNS